MEQMMALMQSMHKDFTEVKNKVERLERERISVANTGESSSRSDRLIPVTPLVTLPRLDQGPEGMSSRAAPHSSKQYGIRAMELWKRQSLPRRDLAKPPVKLENGGNYMSWKFAMEKDWKQEACLPSLQDMK